MGQIIYPTGDSAVSGFTLSAGTDFYALVDDVTPDDDATSVVPSGASDSSAVLTLPTVTDPGGYGGWYVRARAKDSLGTTPWTFSLRNAGGELATCDAVIFPSTYRTMLIPLTFSATIPSFSALLLKALQPVASRSGGTIKLTSLHLLVPDPIAGTGRGLGMMTNRAVTLRATEAQSTAGAGLTTTYAPHQSVRCLIQGKRSSEGGGVQEMEEYGWSGYFPNGVDLRVQDRLVGITGNGALTGKTLEIAGPPIDHAGKGAYQFVPLIEVQE